MKKILLLSLTIVTLFSAFTVLSDPSKDILGQWKIAEESVDGVTNAVITLTAKSNPAMAAQLEEQKEVVKDMVRNMEFEYKADSTYEIQTPQGPQRGKWTFIQNNKYLLISRDGKPDRKDSVLEISLTRLRLINVERGDTTLFIRP
jgi:hypothetical protein